MKPDFPTVLDNSILVEFRGCPQKAFRSHVQHWKPKNQSVHLHAGAAFAKGLEYARRAYWDHGASPDEAVEAGLAALIEFYGDFQCPSDSAKSLERMAGALEYYFHIWPLDQDTAKPLKLASGNHSIEFSFVEPLEINHPVTGDPILYSGKSDMLVGMSNGIFIEDDKTTTSLGASWSGKWELRSQFTGYAWGASRRGQHVDGVLVRGLSILKTKYDTAQVLTYRAQWEIDRWYEQVHRDVERMIQAWDRGHWDYNLGDSCDAYGGCHLTRICKSNNPEEWLQMYFQRRQWDPISHKETVLD